MILVDTSAVLAFLDADDVHHAAAVAAFDELVLNRRPVSSSYGVVECAALVHRRAGRAVTRRLMEDLIPLFTTIFVGDALHRRAVDAWLADLSRGASLVDHVSFELMRELGIEEAFAFDRDFARAGFVVVP